MDALDMILDEQNSENIVLYNENNEPMEFQQIAVIPMGEKTYVILQPVGEFEEIGEDEALVFSIESTDEEEYISIVVEDAIIDAVFEEYYQLLRESGIDV